MMRLLSSRGFVNSERLSRFLRYIVEKSLANEQASLKEYLIGIQVYGRKSDYDPRIDSIVRVEASRLRSRLREYYMTEGAVDPIIIDVPKGGYAASFAVREVLPTEAPAPPVELQPERQPPPPIQIPPGRPLAGRPLAGRPLGRYALLAAALGVLIVSAFIAYRARVPGPPGAIELSLAVLPFLSFTAGQANEDFANGLTEEITDVLTKSGNFRVLGRAAARQFYSRAEPLSSIGKLLNVSAVLEESVRREGDKIRITAQLIDTANGYHRWSETLERDLRRAGGDVFRLQSEISAVIGQSVRTRMSGVGQRPVSRQVQDLLDRGWSQLAGTEEERRAIFSGRASLRPDRSVEQLLQSVRFFEQATALAPDFAPAWSGLSMAYFEMTDYDPRIAGKARDAAREALRRNRNDADAHATLGRISFFWDWNFRQAASEFRQAVDGDPRNSRICRWHADSLVLPGNAEDALAELHRAERLVPASGEIALQLAITLYNAREYQQALDQAQKALALEPRSPLPHWVTGLAHEQLRRYPQALASFQEALRISPDDPRANPALAHLYAIDGKPEPARRILDDLRSRRPGERSAPYSIALIYAGLGDTQAALDWLDRAWSQHDTSLPYALVDPRMDPLRQHPRFQEIARRLRK